MPGPSASRMVIVSQSDLTKNPLALAQHAPTADGRNWFKNLEFLLLSIAPSFPSNGCFQVFAANGPT